MRRHRYRDRAGSRRPKVHRLSATLRADILEQITDAVDASPVLTALGWTAHARRGRFYLDAEGESRARLTPTGPAELLLESPTRSSWTERGRGEAADLVQQVASDRLGTFHGLGALDAVLRQRGPDRLELCAPDDAESEWWYLDLPPTRGPASVVEVLYHAFGVPIPVIAQPRRWWARHRVPAIVDHCPDAVLVDFEQTSSTGAPIAGRCLYARRSGHWRACPIKPAASESVSSSLAWLRKRRWRPW